MNTNILELERKEFLNNVKELRGSQEFKEIQDNFKIRYTHEALKIEETNKVTLDDTAKIINGEKVSGYSEREIKEIQNHYKAINYVEKMVLDEKPMAEDDIKDIHEILVEGILAGGIYRNVNIQIFGAIHQPPDYIKVYDRMKRYFFNLENYKDDPIEKAVYAHAELAKIHPFLDANGRLARLIMNYYLRISGYVGVSIDPSQKKRYFEVLDQFKVEKDINPFVEFTKELLIKRYQELNDQLG